MSMPMFVSVTTLSCEMLEQLSYHEVYYRRRSKQR